MGSEASKIAPLANRIHFIYLSDACSSFLGRGRPVCVPLWSVSA